MSNRVTIKDLEQTFELFAAVHGLKTGETHTRQPDGSIKANPNTYFLSSSFGAVYCICVICEDGRGERQPFGSYMRTARELDDCLRFAMDVTYLYRSKITT